MNVYKVKAGTKTAYAEDETMQGAIARVKKNGVVTPDLDGEYVRMNRNLFIVAEVATESDIHKITTTDGREYLVSAADFDKLVGKIVEAKDVLKVEKLADKGVLLKAK